MNNSELNRELLISSPARTAAHVVADMSDVLVKLRQAARQADWEALFRAAVAAYGGGYTHTLLFANEREAASTKHAINDRTAFEEAFRELAKRDDRQAIADRIRDELSQARPNLLPRVDSILEQIAAGEDDFTELESKREAIAEASRHDDAQVGVDLAIAALCRGLQGLAHYSFNSVAQEDAPDVEHADRTLEAFQNLLNACQADLRQAQIDVYTAVVARRPPQQLIDAAQSVATTVEALAVPFAAAQAHIVRLAAAMREENLGPASIQAGRSLAAAGLFTREAFASHTAAHRLILELRRDFLSPPTSAVVDDAGQTAFSTAMPAGSRAKLSELPQLGDGAWVRVSGFASAFQVTVKADDKLVSRVTLTDPVSNATADADAIFVNLPHAGVTEGSYLELSGVFRTDSVLLGGPAVQIDRLALGELAASSWWLRFLRLADPWFHIWRNSLNLHWSLGFHAASVDDDSNNADRGAAELVYTPFVRS